MSTNLPEVWLRGPLPNMPALLQPVAHALLQAREELNTLILEFPDKFLWHKLSGMASPGFHLKHLAGVLDRLFTYARGEALSVAQLEYLANESRPSIGADSNESLVNAFNKRVDLALAQLQQASELSLTEIRGVGRAQLSTTTIGLYTHAAEHTMRHLGQLLVTVNVLKDNYLKGE